MDYEKIASRYARAIFNHASKNGQVEQIAGYFHMLSHILEQSPLLSEALANPVVNTTTKEQLLLVAAGAGTDELFARILRLILSHKRENFIRWIALHYEEIYKRQYKVADIYLTTAVPVDDETLREITQQIEKRLHATTVIHTAVNPDLIGGLVIEWDTFRYDASLKNRLQKIKKQLTISYDRTNKDK